MICVANNFNSLEKTVLLVRNVLMASNPCFSAFYHNGLSLQLWSLAAYVNMIWNTSTKEEVFGRRKKNGTYSFMALLYSINILCTGSFLDFYSGVSRFKRSIPVTGRGGP
jgi:hypothetical protein